MQDATAQMALLQFMNAGKEAVAVPSTVHCDHLIQAYRGLNAILKLLHKPIGRCTIFCVMSLPVMASVSETGAGIIHQVVLENYAFRVG